MFDNFYSLRREANPDEPIFISLCFVIQYSGTDRDEVEQIFDTYMKVKVDYDKEEKKEMVDYLFKVAQEL